jgi:hypothetical protein
MGHPVGIGGRTGRDIGMKLLDRDNDSAGCAEQLGRVS